MRAMITISRMELAALKERVCSLARESSNLKATVELYNRLSAVPGLENVVENILRLVLETIGCGAISLYYPIGDELWVADVNGGRRRLEEADDPLVRKVLETRQFQLTAVRKTDVGMTAPDLQELSIWVQPLLVGPELVGVLRLEGVLFGDGEPLERLSPFFNYAALVIKNEITGYSVLREAYGELRAANEELVHEMVERRRVEESLRLTQFAVDRASDIILWIDVEGRLFYVNELAVRLLGYSRTELLGMTVGVVAPVFPDEAWPLHWRKIRKQSAITLESRLRTKDGSEFPVEVTINYLELENNEYAIASVRDISRRKLEERQLALAYEQARKELHSASEMQKHLLPPPADLCGFRFAWCYIPCRFVAGDVFNYFQMDESHLAFYLIDVAGHGVPAAMLSFTLCTILSPKNGQLRRLIPQTPGYEIISPREVVAELNRQFQSGPDVASYFTMIYGLIDLNADNLTLVQAGSPHPLLVTRDNQVSEVGDGGPPVGLLEEMIYEEVTIPFAPGDRLVLCSDGVTECADRGDDFFPQELLKQLIREGSDRTLSELLELVGVELRRWRGRDENDDDVTILAIERV
jgi:PAS domain S-box-containing protein